MEFDMSSKDKILEFLEENKESYTSGEAMAAALGLSRNAVWKAINDLRKLGYQIDAVSNKGYRLSEGTDIISKQGILSYLNKDKADMLSDNILIYDTLESTNKLAKERAISGSPNGSLIIAKQQSLGKGRRDHLFYSPEGGIYMSIILSPDFLPTLDKDVITAYTGVSVCQAIEELCGISPSIKPINDLFVNGKKICGILTESGMEYETGLVQWIVVGIGINFDTDVNSFPTDLQEIIGTLFAPGKGPISKNQLIANIYSRLLNWDGLDENRIKDEFQRRIILQNR